MLKLGSLKFLLCVSFFSLHFFTPFLVSVKRPAALRQWLTAQVTEMCFACPSESVCLLHRTHSYSCHGCDVQMLWNAAEWELTSWPDADCYAQYSASKHCLPLQGLITSRRWSSSTYTWVLCIYTCCHVGLFISWLQRQKSMKANVEVMEKIVIVRGVFVSEFSVLRPNKNEVRIALSYYKS